MAIQFYLPQILPNKIDILDISFYTQLVLSNNSGFYHQNRLREELHSRTARNPRYSLRAFAVALGLNASDLSQIMSGKRLVSTKLVNRILKALDLNVDEQRKFIESVLEEKKTRGLKRISPELISKQKQVSGGGIKLGVRDVGLDQFRVIADWYHFAILELTFAKNFKSDSRWIANSLGITVSEAKLAIDRLLELELLEVKDGNLKKTDFHVDIQDKTKTSSFLKRRQKQILEKSIHSLEHDPIEERSHSDRLFCIDPKHIPVAKAKIEKLMWELAELVVEGTPEQVYQLHVGLFPVQKKGESRNDKK